MSFYQTEPLMKYERLNVKLALDLIKNQTQSDEVMILDGGESLEFVAIQHPTDSPTWVRLDNNEQVKSYQWDSNQMQKVAGTLDMKRLRQTIAAFKEKEIQLSIKGNSLHIKAGIITREMEIRPLDEDDLNWDFSFAKEQYDDTKVRMVGCLDPKTLNWFKGALIESTELGGNLWQCFKALRLMKNYDYPVELHYTKDELKMKWAKSIYDGNIMDAITAYFEVDEISHPWNGKTTNGYGGTSVLIENLGRLGKGILKKGKMELTVWENALELNLTVQRAKNSRLVHFRTFIPLSRMDEHRS